MLPISLNYSSSTRASSAITPDASPAQSPAGTEKKKHADLIPLDADNRYSGRHDRSNKVIVPLSASADTRVRLSLVGSDKQVQIRLPRAALAGSVAGVKYEVNDQGHAHIKAKFAGADGKVFVIDKMVLAGECLDLSAALAPDGKSVDGLEEKAGGKAEKYQNGLEGYGIDKLGRMATVSDQAAALTEMVHTRRTLMKDALMAYKNYAVKLLNDNSPDYVKDTLFEDKPENPLTQKAFARLMQRAKQDPSSLTDAREKALAGHLAAIEALNTGLNEALQSVRTSEDVQAVAALGAAVANKSKIYENDRTNVCKLIDEIVNNAGLELALEDIERAKNVSLPTLYAAHAAFTKPLQAQTMIADAKISFSNNIEGEDAFQGGQLVGAGTQQRAMQSLGIAEETMCGQLLDAFELKSKSSILSDMAKTAIAFTTPGFRRNNKETFVIKALGQKARQEEREVTYAAVDGSPKRLVSNKEDLQFILMAEFEKRFEQANGKEALADTTQCPEELKKFVKSLAQVIAINRFPDID